MKVKNLIIGGGFAGLQLAIDLGEALIIESADEVGGLLRSYKSQSGMFTFDIGGHVYTTKDDSLTELLLGANPTFFKERNALYDYERRIPYPIQYHSEELGIQLRCNPRDKYPSLAAMFTHEFGKEFYERVLGPFNKRVWSTNPNKMDADWVMGRVATTKEVQNGWGPNASFYYATGNSILNVLQNKLQEVTIFTYTSLATIDVVNKVAFVEARGPAVYSGAIEYENLFDTTGHVLEMIGVKLPHNNVLTIGVGLNRKIGVDFHWWYNSVENTSPIHRITLLSRYHKDMAPPDVDSLLIEIPYSVENNLGQISRSEIGDVYSKLAVASLLERARFFFIGEKDIEEIVTVYSKGYPIPIITHRHKIALARREMAENNIYLVGRWGAHGYYNLDHVMKDANHARLASLGMSLEDYYWANYYYKEQRRF